MATRTRQEYLKDLATSYITTTVVDSGSKLSKFHYAAAHICMDFCLHQIMELTEYDVTKIRYLIN